MAFTKANIRVPEVDKVFATRQGSYRESHIKAANMEMIQDIYSAHRASIDKWGRVFNLESGILVAFIATESGGKVNAVSSAAACCFGLMQVSPNAVLEAAAKFKQITGVELPSEVRAALVKIIPNFFSLTTVSGANRKKMRDMLLKADFNIMCGTMVLRWSIDRFSTPLTGGQLNKAIIAYNAGAYVPYLNRGAANPIKIPVDTATYLGNTRIPAETRAYLLKMLGNHGFMYLIYKEKAI